MSKYPTRPIPLGKRGYPYDISELEDRAWKAIGRAIGFGERLSNDELDRLGFCRAAYCLRNGLNEVIEWTEK